MPRSTLSRGHPFPSGNDFMTLPTTARSALDLIGDEPAPGSSLYHIISAVSALDRACRE